MDRKKFLRTAVVAGFGLKPPTTDDVFLIAQRIGNVLSRQRVYGSRIEFVPHDLDSTAIVWRNPNMTKFGIFDRIVRALRRRRTDIGAALYIVADEDTLIIKIVLV